MSESKLSDNNGHDQSRKLDMLPGLTKQNPEELEVNDDVRISELVHKIRLLKGPTSIPPRTIQEAKFRNYHFWSREPVPELGLLFLNFIFMLVQPSLVYITVRLRYIISLIFCFHLLLYESLMSPFEST